MIEIIFNNRPVEFLRPISWVNGITRMKSKGAFDHISARKDGLILESSAGKGVHKQPFDEWRKGREGTTIFIYSGIPDYAFDMDVFNMFLEKGTKYDYKANVLYLLGMYKKLKKNNLERQFCSELIANCIAGYMISKGFEKYKEPYLLTPVEIETDLRHLATLRTETI